MVNLATNINEVGKVNNNLQEALDTYFKELEHQSQNTVTNYRGWFEDFFKFVYDKEMKFVTWQDIADTEYINVNTIKKYRIYLSDKKDNGNGTINMKVSALKALFQELNNVQFIPLNMGAFNVKRLKEGKSKGYGALSDKEIEDLYEYCKQYENNGFVKYMMFKMLYVIAFRFEKVRLLKWRDVKKGYDNKAGIFAWTIEDENEGKTSKHNFTKSISDNFYEELLQLETSKNKNNYIFSFDGGKTAVSDETIRQCFNRYCERYDLDKGGRRLTIHSLKHSSSQKAYELSNHNIKVTQYQSNHMKPQTTMEKYQEDEIPLTEQISYIIDRKIDKTQLDNLSQEDLLSLIKAANDSIFLELARQAKIKGLV